MLDEKTYTITEAASITGYEPHVLRYYEKEFNLNIPRNKANHRYYTYKEIEQLQYIKQLQNKGFTNTQIKLILNSPEYILHDTSKQDTAATKTGIVPINTSKAMEKMFYDFRNEFKEEIQRQMEYYQKSNLAALSNLVEEIKLLIQETKKRDKDIELCENAKLRMQLKQRTYEVVELKDQIRRLKENKKSFLAKIFGK